MKNRFLSNLVLAVFIVGLAALSIFLGKRWMKRPTSPPEKTGEAPEVISFSSTVEEEASEPGGFSLSFSAGAPIGFSDEAYEDVGGAPLDAREEPGPALVETWKRSRIVPNTSRLMIGDEEELPLKGLQANVRIDGFRARVLLDCYFLNDRDEEYEGTFKLRLPNEASPFYLAFGATSFQAPDISDVAAEGPQFYARDRSLLMSFDPRRIRSDRGETWENVQEARMVPREKAAFAYTETVRRRVDPALLEWAGAGIFSARVFPLAPMKLHRIVLGYDVNLLPAGDDLEFRFDLPQGVPRKVVDMSVSGFPEERISVTPEAEPIQASGRISYRFEHPADPTILLRLLKPGPILLTGGDEKTGPHFALRYRPEIPEGAPATRSPSAVFLVDTSLSSNPEGFNVWLKLLEAILANNRPGLKRFAVLFFNIEAFWWKETLADNTPETVGELMRYARSLALEGATDLGRAMAEASEPGWLEAGGGTRRYDVFLLSDGAATWGEDDLYALSRTFASGPAGPIFSYTTGLSGVDSPALLHLTRESGGAVFSVVGEAEIAKASTAHRSRPWRIQSIRLEGAADILIAGRPRVIFPGQTLLVVGRGMPEANAKMTLSLHDGDRRTIETRPASTLRSELAPRIYGQVAVNQLEEFENATEEFSKAYASHFRVTGRTCSLLMLESEEDYERFNIQPEEDAFVVKGNPASTLIGNALEEIAEALGDPKASFLAWLKKMERIPGAEFEISTAFQMALDGMPREVFAVAPAPLSCKLRTWDGVPGSIQEQLASHELDYDQLTAEGERRRKDFGPADALKALSSLIENSPRDAVLARDVGFSAMEWNLGGQAYHLFRRVATARPYEPQTYRAMARLLEEMGKADLALAYYEIALTGKWPDRFGEFRRILGLEYLRFLRRLSSGDLQVRGGNFARARLETVEKEFSFGKPDLVVTITWNTDGTDIDLHVIEPTGEECYYEHTETKIGGRITEDVTGGYGPEMYTLRRAVAGEYRIRVKYYSEDRSRASARTKVYSTIYERWGTPEERVTRKVVILREGEEMHDIATVKM